ncbi:unnamed protein product [Soboliphyme baturini]|uniref:Uncharacterized protein n=1 Tax=Soboliphyme baturini TaxID=241478 RepID=A0A183J7G5_9BILA|nr:unnamed protein product [Soboliphyme baturini]
MTNLSAIALDPEISSFLLSSGRRKKPSCRHQPSTSTEKRPFLKSSGAARGTNSRGAHVRCATGHRRSSAVIGGEPSAVARTQNAEIPLLSTSSVKESDFIRWWLCGGRFSVADSDHR